MTTAEASQDLNAVVDYVLKLRNAKKVELLGWSWGTQYGGMFVMNQPAKVDRYVSFAQMQKGHRTFQHAVIAFFTGP